MSIVTNCGQARPSGNPRHTPSHQRILVAVRISALWHLEFNQFQINEKVRTVIEVKEIFCRQCDILRNYTRFRYLWIKKDSKEIVRFYRGLTVPVSDSEIIEQLYFVLVFLT